MLPSFYAEQKNKRIQGGQIALNLLILAIVLFLGFIYLVQINGLISQDYAIKKNKQELDSLRTENKKLKAEATQLQSLSWLQGAVRDFDLVEAGDVNYLSKHGGKMVTR